jgi:hypothetical protein
MIKSKKAKNKNLMFDPEMRRSRYWKCPENMYLGFSEFEKQMVDMRQEFDQENMEISVDVLEKTNMLIDKVSARQKNSKVK